MQNWQVAIASSTLVVQVEQTVRYVSLRVSGQ